MKAQIIAPLILALFVFGPAFAHGEFDTFGENTTTNEPRERHVDLPPPDQKDDMILGEDRRTRADRPRFGSVCFDDACSKTDFSEPGIARRFDEETNSYRCNTPEDGRDSIDEGDRVTCPTLPPRRR